MKLMSKDEKINQRITKVEWNTDDNEDFDSDELVKVFINFSHFLLRASVHFDRYGYGLLMKNFLQGFGDIGVILFFIYLESS